MILECICHMLISPPGYETKICYYVLSRIVCSTLSDILMLLAILRLYIFIRVFNYYMQWSNKHCREVCDVHFVKPSWSYIAKCNFHLYPFRFLSIFILVVALVSSFSIRIFERAYYATSPEIVYPSPQIVYPNATSPQIESNFIQNTTGNLITLNSTLDDTVSF